MNKFQSMVIRVCGIKFDDEAVKFSVELAQRATLQKGIDIGRKELPAVPDCSHCPIYLKTSPHEMTAFEQRPPTTEGKLAVEGAHYKSIRRHLTSINESQTTTERKDDKPDWWKRRNPHLVETQSVLPKIRFTTVKLDPMPPT